MKLDDMRETDNVDDRRGQGGGGGFGGGGFGGRRVAVGGGGLGLVVVVILALVFGVDPSELLSGLDTGAPPAASSRDQASDGPRSDDQAFSFSRKIIASTEDVWSDIFREHGMTYEPAIFTPYDGQTQTAGCGGGEAAMGPFYCPADRRVYIDLTFFRELSERFGAPGDFAQAYVIAHEIGHNIQMLLGINERVQQAARRGGQREANRASVKLELQADCFAGVWANRANQRSQILEAGDVEEGLAAANAVGDDTLQRQTNGRVVPDAFTHGTSAERMRWFRRGLDTGDPEACDTFGTGVFTR